MHGFLILKNNLKYFYKILVYLKYIFYLCLIILNNKLKFKKMNTYLFTNDHDKKQKAFGTLEQIKEFLTSNWEIENIEKHLNLENITSCVVMDLEEFIENEDYKDCYVFDYKFGDNKSKLKE